MKSTMARPRSFYKGRFDIICPEIGLTDSDISGSLKMIQVTRTSRKTLREAVATISRFLAHECDYDPVGLFGADGDEDLDSDPYVAYLFPPNSSGCRPIWEAGWITPMIGASCFRQRQGSPEPIWTLAWMYIHPFFRGRQMMTQYAWEHWKKEFGDFPVEHPITPAMQKFLAKRG